MRPVECNLCRPPSHSWAMDTLGSVHTRSFCSPRQAVWQKFWVLACRMGSSVWDTVSVSGKWQWCPSLATTPAPLRSQLLDVFKEQSLHVFSSSQHPAIVIPQIWQWFKNWTLKTGSPFQYIFWVFYHKCQVLCIPVCSRYRPRVLFWARRNLQQLVSHKSILCWRVCSFLFLWFFWFYLTTTSFIPGLIFLLSSRQFPVLLPSGLCL